MEGILLPTNEAFKRLMAAFPEWEDLIFADFRVDFEKSKTKLIDLIKFFESAAVHFPFIYGAQVSLAYLLKCIEEWTPDIIPPKVECESNTVSLKDTINRCIKIFPYFEVYYKAIPELFPMIKRDILEYKAANWLYVSLLKRVSISYYGQGGIQFARWVDEIDELQLSNLDLPSDYKDVDEKLEELNKSLLEEVVFTPVNELFVSATLKPRPPSPIITEREKYEPEKKSTGKKSTKKKSTLHESSDDFDFNEFVSVPLTVNSEVPSWKSTLLELEKKRRDEYIFNLRNATKTQERIETLREFLKFETEIFTRDEYENGCITPAY